MTPTIAVASEFLDAYVHIPAAQQRKVRERSLLLVAATRARDMLIVTGWGIASPFLPRK